MKKFEITKEQVVELSKENNVHLVKAQLKGWFPKAFENELEVGKWYTPLNQYEGVALVCIVNPNDKKNLGYGFDYSGMWIKENYTIFSLSNFRQATDKEVETALIEEAKRRGFKANIDIKLTNGYITKFTEREFKNIFLENGVLFCHSNIYPVFKNGKWAEIINEPLTLTIDEIAEKFGTTADKIKICK